MTKHTNNMVWTRFQRSRSKVKLMSHFNATHVLSPANVATNYQPPTPYGFRDTV